MPINFIPNDPKASGGPPMRKKTPRAERASNVAGYSYVAHAPAAPHPLGNPEFLFWQSREAAIAALVTYEALAGKKVTRWARSTPLRKLDLEPNEGIDLNAYYNGQSISFFEYTTGAKTTWSGESTDVVAHEAGHGVLDAIRPELWDSPYLEAAAFHEAFGDCTAIFAALADAPTRARCGPSCGAKTSSKPRPRICPTACCGRSAPAIPLAAAPRPQHLPVGAAEHAPRVGAAQRALE
jgi:hypothetical protein